jgi:GNAT superfamily N-acetyltransferase
MKLIKNKEEYWDFIRILRSNEKVQDGFIENVKISKEQQKAYMKKHNDEYYVCLVNEEPIGFVGSVDNDIRVCTHPDYQKMGYGKFMINELMRLLPNSFAKVKFDNTPSNALFRACGFKKIMEDSNFFYYKKNFVEYRQPLHNPFKIVKMFEEEVADYTGAPYAVAVDSCTNALFLCLMYMKDIRRKNMNGRIHPLEVTIPSRTYLSVPMSIIQAGFTPVFKDYEWSGMYPLEPLPIIDAAKRLTSNMYMKHHYMCLSFHIKKTLSIGKGGMILTDDKEAVEWFKKARYEGRSEINYKDDNVDMVGWNMYMTPQEAAHGLALMQNYPLHMDDLGEKDGYKDLKQNNVFKNYEQK